MLVFIDESGYPLPTDASEYSTLLAVCIEERDVRSITNSIYKLKTQVYGKQDEIKAINLIKRQTIEKNRTKNKEYAEKFVNTVCLFKNVHVFCIIVKRPTTKPTVENGVLPKHYQLLMKKIEYFSVRHNSEKAIFVFDETTEGNDYNTALCFDGFLYKSKLGKTFRHILEIPLFVSSKITPMIQIADIFAGITRQYYQSGLHDNLPKDDYEKWLASLYKKIIAKTEDGYQDNGIYFERGFQYIENLNYVKKHKKF